MGLFSNIKLDTDGLDADDQFNTFDYGTRIVNAALSAWFGYAHGAAIFPTGDAMVSGIIGAFAFFLILDGGAFGWNAAALRDKISPLQRQIADKMSARSMYSSTGISAVQIITTMLAASLPDAVLTIVEITGAGIIVWLMALHFIKGFKYRASSPAAQKARREGIIQSAVTDLELQQEADLLLKTAEQVFERKLLNLDHFAEEAANKEWTRYRIDKGFQARPQVQSEDKGNAATAPPPPPPEDAIIDTDQEAPKEKDAIIDLELMGNARTAAEQNLNMAAG